MKKSKISLHRPSVRFEPMPSQATERACHDCLDDIANSKVVSANPAEHYGYAVDKKGSIDRSSRRPICTGHAN